MSEEELKSYRFNSGQDPSDEMLSQIMKEAACDAKKKNEDATKAYFSSLKKMAEENSLKWESKLSQLKINGE